MTIVVISDEYRQEAIGATIDSVPAIVDFLVEYDDIDGSYWIPVSPNSLDCVPIESLLGKDWKNALKRMSLQDLNAFFNELYKFETMSVYGSYE